MSLVPKTEVLLRVLIYGGRNFVGEERHFDLLDYLFADYDPGEVVVISGTARGADALGEAWANRAGHPVERYPAKWKVDGVLDRTAGFKRNQQMLDTGIDYAVEFPGGNGTADMRRRLDAADVTVWTVEE